MWGSSVPGALTALTAVFSAAAGNVDVLMGPVVGNAARSEVIIVGFEGDAGHAVEAQLTRGDIGLRGQQETFLVNCQLAVMRGSGPITTPVTRVFELLAAVGDTLTADQTLNGAVIKAAIADWALVMQETGKGPLALINLTVEVDAFTTR